MAAIGRQVGASTIEAALNDAFDDMFIDAISAGSDIGMDDIAGWCPAAKAVLALAATAIEAMKAVADADSLMPNMPRQLAPVHHATIDRIMKEYIQRVSECIDFV